MNEPNNNANHDWARLSFGEFLRRTPTGLLFASIVGLLTAGWTGGTYFNILRNPIKTCTSDTFFIKEAEKQGTPDRCIARTMKFFTDRDGKPVIDDDNQITGYPLIDETQFACFIDCGDETTLQVVCSGPTITASQGVTEQITQEINK